MILSVEDLIISFNSPFGRFRAVNGIGFSLEKGKSLGIIGESGCGKSVTALSLMGLSKYSGATIESGKVLFHGQNLIQTSDEDWRRIRGKKISMIFQEPMTSLNPVFRIGEQLVESILVHEVLSPNAAKERAYELMNLVGIPDPKDRFEFYPHELSGGLRQRVMIAMALSCNPEILVADEPTTALDVTIQAQILALIKSLQTKLGMSLILITHDFGVVSEMADEIAVMYAGKIVEFGTTQKLMSNASHPYTRALQKAIPVKTEHGRKLYSIPFSVPRPSELARGINLDSRWNELEQHLNSYDLAFHHEEATSVERIDPSGVEITDKIHEGEPRSFLKVENLSVEFSSRAGAFSGTSNRVKAVNDMSFELRRGETLGLVGESGCGKSTLARSIAQLVRPKNGKIIFKNEPLFENRKFRSTEIRKHIQMIFQDPFSSLNPRMKIQEIIEEPLKIHFELSAAERAQRARELLESVGLNEEIASKYPHEFSGGQRQRIGLARALAVGPELLIADEPVSALDVSIQAQILNLLQDLKRRYNLTLLFISHDLNVIQYLCDRVLVMYKGQVVEELTAQDLKGEIRPKNEYTRRLLDSIPKGYSKLSQRA